MFSVSGSDETLKLNRFYQSKLILPVRLPEDSRCCIQSPMTGKRLLKRFIVVFLGTVSFLAFVNAVQSHANYAQPRTSARMHAQLLR